jgi:hypothetical protein
MGEERANAWHGAPMRFIRTAITLHGAFGLCHRHLDTTMEKHVPESFEPIRLQ